MTPLVLGVTGHRGLAEVDRLAAGVDRALDVIERRFPGRPLVALSALAEGADRLVVERVLARPGARLEVVLPLARADYATDFASPESRRAFDALLARAAKLVELPARGGRDAAYEEAGRFVVDHSDALVAIWDGAPARGRGGTGVNVERARARGLPIAWILAENRPPGASEATTPGVGQGRLMMENL